MAGTTVHWRLCQACHKRVWPADLRVGNRHSRPFVEPMPGIRGGKRRLVVGDFYLTEAPPEPDPRFEFATEMMPFRKRSL